MLIGIHDLNKYFGETPALLDVNLQVEAGDRIGIVGANGRKASSISPYTSRVGSSLPFCSR